MFISRIDLILLWCVALYNNFLFQLPTVHISLSDTELACCVYINIFLYLLSLFALVSDINESEAEIHNCSSEAVSNSTKGSFNCTCKPGYKGDGYNCTGNVWGGLVCSQRIIQKHFCCSFVVFVVVHFFAGFSFFISCETCCFSMPVDF